MALLAALALSLLPFRATGSETVTVNAYVVQADSSQDESLEGIAERTLRDPRRADELLALNRSRRQADGLAPGDITVQARAGWVLVMPEDAIGPDVRPARLEVPKPYWTGPLVLSLVAAVGIGLLTVVLTLALLARQDAESRIGAAARRIRDGFRRRLGARRARRAVRIERDWLRRTLDTDRSGAQQLRAAMASAAGDPNTDVYAAEVDSMTTTVRVSSTESAPEGWTWVDDSTWVAERLPVSTEDNDGVALPVHVGGSDGRVVLVDFSRLDGVLSVSGDPGIAKQVLDHLVAEVACERPEVPVVRLAADDPQQVLSFVTGTPAWPDTPQRSPEVFASAAGRRRIEGVLLVPFDPSPTTVAALLEVCASNARTGWVALVCGEVLGAHWLWRAHRNGSLELPELGTTVVVPHPAKGRHARNASTAPPQASTER